MPSIIALDIETTGLDPQRDTIIEIGAVRFNGKRVEKEFSTLINPKREIPPMITQLTGITNEMVMGAPPIQAVLQDLEDFIKDDPILGHNIRFDLSFLQRYPILEFNDVLDTYELASFLLPGASRYNLGSLCQIMGILPPGQAHRALTDAHMTRALYLNLYERLVSLPFKLLEELARLSEPLDWDAAWVINQALRDLARMGVSPQHHPATSLVEDGPLFSFQDAPHPPLSPRDPPLPLDIDEITSLLEFGGPFAQYFGGYEHRPQQIEMLRAVTQALSDSLHLMVEAGTGTGKSFAYLVPAALWAIQNNQRVVISTNTINLQEQLIKKDIPDLKAALNLDLRSAVMKGRSNYLCPHRLQVLRQRIPESSDEMRLLAKILVWLLEGGSGDRGEINLNGPVEREVWMRLSAENEGCRGEVCLGKMGGDCPFYRARQQALGAHLLVVNHALLLSDVATGSRVLPEYHHLIIDEAHHLENATTNALSYRVTQNDLARLLRELGSTSSGVMGYLLTVMRNLVRPADLAAFHKSIERVTDLAFRLDHDFTQFFKWIEQFLAEQRDGQPIGNYGQQERILPATRTQPNWSNVEIAWDQAFETARLLLNLLNQVHNAIGDLGSDLPEELEDTQGNIANIIRRLQEAINYLHALVMEPDSAYVYWAEIQSNSNKIALQVAPLHIGSLMEQYLWHEKESVILTSATLTANGEFNYLRSRLNADEADELALGSPFDYENSALLYLANDIPEPHDTANYQRSIERTLIRLSKATGGRLLALFTSYAQLKRTSQAIAPALLEDGILIYEQGEGASANTLLENFRNAERAVLLGTRSFWEGVDIPGEALSVLVIVKIPFDVPSDPIIAARSETFEDPFNEYSLPEAILRFRQGFGRLIRTQTDRGMVAVLDRRIISKRYGKMFIDSLPACKIKVGSLNDIPATAARWLNL